MTTPSTGVSAERHRRWQGHVDAQARGTLSQRAYCEANELAYSSFTYWRRRVADRRQADARGEPPNPTSTELGPTFVPVRVATTTPGAAAGPGPTLAVVLPSGVRIEGIGAAHIATVTALAAAL